MRWVYLPPGAAIDARDDADWDFPVGTKFWKEFSFNGRKAETRMLWKAAFDRWIGVSYKWNEDQSEAFLATADGELNVAEVAPGKSHSIPSREECHMCHGGKRTEPLGFNPLQLSTDRDPNAIHGEPVLDGMITLRTLVVEGLLIPDRSDLLINPPRIATRDPLTRSVLGYFTANCGTCHTNRGEIATLGPSLRYSEIMQAGDTVARQLVNQPTHWQVPGVPEGQTVFVNAKAPDTSAILVRMRSRRPSSQMPPLGTVLKDTEAIDAVDRWINQSGCHPPMDRTTQEPWRPSIEDTQSSVRGDAQGDSSCRGASRAVGPP
jgi:mono/diheme cytochrome c family protein